MKALKTFAMLFALAFLPAVVNGQASPNTNSQAAVVAPPATDSGALAALKIRFQASMRWMDSMMTIPISPTGPYPWEEDEAEKTMQKLFDARRKFYPYGDFHDAVEADSAWAERLGLHYGPRSRCDMGNWQPVGPVGDPEPSSDPDAVRQNKNGRLDKITFKPGDPNTLYVASGKGGGLWKVNGTTGNAVSLNTDHISLHNGVSSVAAIPGRLIIATGQSYFYLTWDSWPWACTGVYYSNDDGQSWLRAGVTDHNGQDPFAGYGYGQYHYVSDIVVNPSNSNKMLMTVFTHNVASDNNPLNYGALFSSSDGGITWTEVNDPALGNRYFRSIAYNPVNSNIVYLTSQQHLYKSTDAGQSWSDITYRLTDLNALMPVDTNQYESQWYRMTLMVPAQGCSASDGNHVAIIVTNFYSSNHYIIYHSADAFATSVSPIVQTPAQQDRVSWGSYFHNGAAMTHDPEVLYMGGTKIQRSDNGGLSFTTNNGYGQKTHADHEEIAVPPYDGTNAGVVFAATDGGLWRSDDSAHTFHSLNSGLMINQFYGIAASQSDNTLLGGTQDNANIRLQPNGIWKALYVGDGSRFSAIDPVDPELYAWEDLQEPSQINLMERVSPSLVGQGSFFTTPGPWNRPMLYESNTLMVAVDKMYYCDNGSVTTGNTFKSGLPAQQQVDFIFGNQAVFFDYCRSQPNVVYASTYGQWKDTHGGFVCNDTSRSNHVDYDDPNGYTKYDLWKSTDGGHNWTDVSPEIPGANGLISSIAVNPYNPDMLWITYSGYANHNGSRQNIYRSSNGGGSWQDVSQGLPKGNTEKVLYDQSSNRLFLAMESGIFYKDVDGFRWYCFEDGLPYTNIEDIAISYCSNKIYAATYGRGIWESDLSDDPVNFQPGETDTISSNTTWNSSQTIIGSVRIKTGAALTISGANTTIYMPKNGRILVEPNAQLIVDGATITNNCSACEWQGIEVTGNNTQPPVLPYQGDLELRNGATLENANAAIRNFTGDNDAQGGGIIHAANSTIRNCWRQVELNGYEHTYYTSDNVSQCSFENMNFIIDDTAMYAIHTAPADLFTSFDTRDGVELLNCHFSNALSLDEEEPRFRGRAVYIASTGIKVENCSFDGFEKGFYSLGYAGLPSRSSWVTGNEFNHVTDNITLAASAYGTIRSNSINNMRPYSYSANYVYYVKFGVGIYLDHAQGTNVTCLNGVDGLVDGAGSVFPNLGVVVNNSNNFWTKVGGNRFTNLTVGTQTQENNTNLQIFCNTYNDNDNAWAINPQSTAAIYHFQDQGTGCGTFHERAGNSFSGNQLDIGSYLMNSWTYWAGNAWGAYPALISGTVNVAGCSDADEPRCGHINCLVIHSATELGDAMEAYTDLKLNNEQYGVQGRLLFTNIVQGFNNLSDIDGLQTFLEGEDDDNARKSLIGLYLETGAYDSIPQTINRLTLSETDRQAYTDYYNLLINLKQDDRNIMNLNREEQTTVTRIAQGGFEVSPYAKGLLEWAYDSVWVHETEEIPAARPGVSSTDTMSIVTHGLSSRLLEATPNPAREATLIHTVIIARDATRKPALVVRDITGKEMFHAALTEGDQKTTVNTRSWNPGIYFYSLWLNGKAVSTRKLSIK